MAGSLYAFAGGKGGVGKTTTTANVGLALATEFDVAVVDADVGLTNLGALLDHEPVRGVHHVLAGEAAVEDVVVEGPGGLDVVPGEEGLLASGRADPANLRRVVDPLRERYDVVLLDTGAGVNHQNFVAYGLADYVAVVTTPKDVSVTDAAKTVEMVEHVDGTVLGVVVVRADEETAGDVGERLGEDVLGAIPEYEADEPPEPRLEHAPASPASQAFRRLAAPFAVCHETGNATAAVSAATEPATTDASGSLLGKLGLR